MCRRHRRTSTWVAGACSRLSKLRADHRVGARYIVEAPIAAEQHAGEGSLYREACGCEQGSRLGFGVCDINVNRSVDFAERVREQRLRHLVVVCDQRAEMRGDAAVATEQHADNL